MCGIVGLYQWPLQLDEMALRLSEMHQSLYHRGPDDEGIFVSQQTGLGMRRLSIIDVAGGRQPIHNEDGSITVVFNGEIFNYKALRDNLLRCGHKFRTQTDTETIVHAYEEYGLNCLKYFNGIFAFALWDASACRLLLARDRMGVKPLYYTRRQSGLAFASEIKALLTLPDIPRRLNLEAAAQFFRLGYVPAPLTLFQNIYKLPAGCQLIADNGQVELAPYWDLEFPETDETVTFAECRDQLNALLHEVVADQMVSDVPLGAFLSGGVDSSAVVACMRQAAGSGVRTYSIGFDQQHAYHDETSYAEAVARHFGTQHETLIVRPRVADLMPSLVAQLDEPLVDTSFLVTYLVSKLASQHVKVVLSGLGGDELFGGYRRYLAPGLRKSVSWIPTNLQRAMGKGLTRFIRADRGTVRGNLGRYAKSWGQSLHLAPSQQYLDLISVLPADHVAALMGSCHVAGYGDPGAHLLDCFDRITAPTPLDRIQYVDMKTVLPESLLLLTDKMAMATSLEVRVPFLDNRLVDFICRVPSHYRLQGLSLKRLLKSALKGVIPDFVLTRSKRGFGTPMSDWLRTDLRTMVADLLAEQRIRRHGFLNTDVIRDMVTAHEGGREDYTEPIVALLTFELWREQFGVTLP